MNISVIIVSYNSRAVLEPCLESLKKQSLFHRTEVIVVDNASVDGTPDMVRARFPWVNLNAATKNVGFSRGVNVGIGEAKGRYFLIMNPDTVVREDSIERLVDFMERTPDAGIVGPKLIFHDGNLQYSCRRFYNWKVLLLRRTLLGKVFKDSEAVAEHLMLDFDHESTRQVDWILGACMLVRREAVQSVGAMDERFFLYFEDVDWCYRMKQKGWGVYYHPEAVVVHDYARDSAQSVVNRSFVAHLASLIRYYEKWNFVLYFVKKYRAVIKVLLFLAVDIAAFNLAFLSAYYLRLYLDDIFTNPIYPIGAYERFVFFQNLLFVFTYSALGLYRIRRETGSVDELFVVGKAIILASILLMTSTYLGQIRTYSRMVVAFLVPFSVAYDWWLRTAVRKAHRKLLAQKIDLKRVCIVGPLAKAKDLELRLLDEASLGVEVVGFIPGDEPPPGERSRTLGSIDELQDIVDRYRLQELIFLPGAVAEERIADFVTLGRRRALDITVMSDYTSLVVHHAAVGYVAGRPAITYQRDTRYLLDRLTKRVLDVVLGGIFLLISLPSAVLYFLYTSFRGRTAFTGDERLGLGGRPFILPIAGDRSSSGPSDIVNLPLFWLVVTGKISMVGPYPLAPPNAAKLGGKARFRFDVRPGVTGYWRALREEALSLDELLALDANYISNWSLVQDLKLFVMTFGSMLTGKKRFLRIAQDP